jgi:hypothetical protein
MRLRRGGASGVDIVSVLELPGDDGRTTVIGTTRGARVRDRRDRSHPGATRRSGRSASGGGGLWVLLGVLD